MSNGNDRSNIDLIYDAVLEEVKKKITEDPQVQSSQSNTDEKQKDKCKPCCCTGWFMPLLSLLYIVMLGSVLRYTYDAGHLAANQCVIIVTILVLSTLLLILSAVYMLKLKALCIEAAKEDEKKKEKKVRAPKTYKELVAEKIQEKILDKVVNDTVAAFEKRI